MATIIYALSGQGRGHTSRVMALSGLLRERGHTVHLCCGGTARQIFEAEGEAVIPVPALRQILEGNEIRLFETVRTNWRAVVHQDAIARGLADAFAAREPDLLITDFEAFSPKAAARLGLPVLSFNHQQVVTEAHYAVPARCWFQALMTGLVIRMIAPRDPAHVALTSFFYPPLKRPARTTLVPPIIRPAVQRLTPRRGDHVLVYYNETGGADHVVETLAQVDARFVLYNFPRPAHPERYPNLRFEEPSLGGFLDDLAASRAVICTAGFTLISEALYLGKPLLVVPNRGIFEQTLNALFLERDGLGEAVLDRPLAPADVRGFLDRLSTYEARLLGREACGNEAALDCIERVLAQTRPARRRATPRSAPEVAAPVLKPES